MKKIKNRALRLFSICLMLVFLVYSNINFFVQKKTSCTSHIKIEQASKTLAQLIGDSELNEDDTDDDANDYTPVYTKALYTCLDVVLSYKNHTPLGLPAKFSFPNLFVLINVFRI